MPRPAPHAGAVRPFAGRLVMPEWAQRVVAPMAEGAGAPALQDLLGGAAFGEPELGFFVYRIEDAIGEYVGLVADVDTEAFVDDRVRGHEAVQPARVEGVRRRFAAVPIRSELVALLHSSADVVGDVVARAQLDAPVLSFTSADGLRQTVWRVDAQDEELTCAALGRSPLYVADGHHRVAASLAEWEAQGRPTGSTVPCVLYAVDGLRLQPFHRRVRGPVDAGVLLDGLRSRLALEPAQRDEPGVGRVAVYVGGQWFCAALPPSAAVGVDALDVTQLHAHLLGPLLGIELVADPRLEVVPASSPVAGMVDACDADGGAAFVLAPPTFGQLIDVADRGQVMMAKSTFFAPKPQAGVFVQVIG